MSEGPSKENNSRLCGICEETTSKYCCPRCDIFYCSLDCYKSEKHSECSEDFYRDCINEELASHNVDEESKHKMIDILKRMKDGDELDDIPEVEELDSDDDEGIDLQERIKDLNLDDADAVWNALTEDEKNEFQTMLDQGDVGAIMPQWEPWWMYRKQDKLVEEVTELNEEEDALKKCPQIKIVPELSSLTKVQPSPAIKFNIANVLASYAFIMRYFNGEVEPIEGVTYFLDICINLSSNANFEEPAVAVESVAQRCLQSEMIETDEASLDVMKYDIYLLLQGPSEQNKMYYCKAALSDLINILTAAKDISKKTKTHTKPNKGTFSKKFPDHEKSDWNKLDGSKIKGIIKKVEYYLSYIQSSGLDLA
ncbi:zinc finger HIT domain-containing protein 2 [Epargyreus clarus]|uniref:zinc finger HIT domain-containing protein 2 n=1 Tax=Epargyreus clarus TaxID=520877 RepID=UPI003C2B5C83